MDSLREGEPYIAGRRDLRERAGYSYSADGQVLSIFMRSPDRRKVEAVRRGRSQFALVIGPGIFFLMYRFGKAIGWSAAPYWGALSPNQERTLLVEGWPAGDVVLNVVLVDAATGIIRSVRTETLPLDFSCDLRNAIRHQAQLPILDKRGFDSALAKMHKLCPTSRRLLQRAVACTGPVPREKLAHRIWLREHRLNLLFDLLNWFSIHADGDKEVNIYADNVRCMLDAELMKQGFMRVDGTFEIPHE